MEPARPTRRRILPPVGMGAVAVVLLMGAAGLASVNKGAPPIPDEESWDARLVWALLAMPAPVVGALIAARRRDSPYGWVWLVMGLGLAVQSMASEYVIFGLSNPGAPFLATAGVLSAIGWSLAFFSIPLVLLLFPSGRLPSPRWRPVLWVAIGGAAISLLLGVFMPGQGVAPIESPLAVEGPVGRAITLVVGVATVAVLACSIPAAASLFIRYRSADAIERLQLKWFSYAAFFLVSILVLDWVWELEGIWESLKEGIPLALLPVAIAIAILRYRLYDIDRILSRTVSYAVVTALLVGLFMAVVFLLQLLLPAQSDLATAASTLAVAAAFNPVRKKVQDVVDRRFNRSRYDAVRTVEQFSRRLRSATDVGMLRGELQVTAATVMEPRHLSLWLRQSEL